MPSAWRGFLRAYFWNHDKLWRVINWLNVVNVLLSFTPIRATPGRFVYCVVVILFTLGAVLCGLLKLHRQYRHYKAFRKQADFWVLEMQRILAELHHAEECGLSLSERMELADKLNDAKQRAEREVAIYEKTK
jgi:hypothetical protein